MLLEKYQFEISYGLFWSKFYFTKAFNDSFTLAISIYNIFPNCVSLALATPGGMRFPKVTR